jgi:predicted enzyme related to lactoylglutathione lyase
MHLCLQPDIPRDQEVDRLVGLGATVVADRRNSATGGGWVVMGDPEGNEFCVLRSVAEWPASARPD